MHGFMFATGIENSYPTITGGLRIDQMEKCGHYERWRDDLRLVRDLGLFYLRWGPALHKVFLAPGRYDWHWYDEVMHAMDELSIQPILDLCHFGVPDWLGNFQNGDFPNYFAEYAAAVAQLCRQLEGHHQRRKVRREACRRVREINELRQGLRERRRGTCLRQ